MSGFDQEDFDVWLKANSPGGTGLRIQPEDGDLLAVSFAAAAPFGTPVVANSTLVGSGAQRALQLDAAYATAPDVEAVARLQESPATGCTMLLTLARERSGYNPSIPAQSGSADMFLSYLQQILLCPLFVPLLNEHINPQFSGSWNNVVDQILGYYPGMLPADLQVLRDGLYRIAAAASSSPATDQTLNMFSQATLSVGANIDVFLYQTNVQMRTTVRKGGKREPDTVSNQALMSLYRVQLRFLAERWPSQAKAVHEQTQDSLADWLADNATPVGPLPANWQPRAALAQ